MNRSLFKLALSLCASVSLHSQSALSAQDGEKEEKPKRQFDVISEDPESLKKPKLESRLSWPEGVPQEIMVRIEKGDPEAICALGILYANGKITGEPDSINAQKYLHMGIKKGDPGAMCALGYLYAEGKITSNPDFINAKKYLDMAIKNGHRKSMYNLGYLYGKGKITGNPDYINTKKYFDMAIKNGHRKSMASLGYLYAEGKITGNPDYINAKKYYDMAIERDHIMSMYELGMLYDEGKITDKPDYTTAFRLVEKASLNGSLEARKHFQGCFSEIHTKNNRSLVGAEFKKTKDFFIEVTKNIGLIKDTFLPLVTRFGDDRYNDTIECKILSKKSLEIYDTGFEIINLIHEICDVPGYFMTCVLFDKKYIGAAVLETVKNSSYISTKKSIILEKLDDLKKKIISFDEINSTSKQLLEFLFQENKTKNESIKFDNYLKGDKYLAGVLCALKIANKDQHDCLISLLTNIKKLGAATHSLTGESKEIVIKDLTAEEALKAALKFTAEMNKFLSSQSTYCKTLEENFIEWLRKTIPLRNDLYLTKVLGK